MAQHLSTHTLLKLTEIYMPVYMSAWDPAIGMDFKCKKIHLPFVNYSNTAQA